MSLFKEFINNVKRYPNRIALCYVSLEEILSRQFLNNSLSYQQLNNDIGKLGNWLNEYNLKNGDYIYVIMDPSILLITLLLVCWKNKFVYVPIHESYFNYAENRKYIFIETRKLKDINYEGYRVISCPYYPDYSLLINDALIESRENDYKPVEKYNYRYIMHTSGTTRKGKNGITVRVPENSLYWNVIDIIRKIGLNKRSHYYGILMTSPSFDPSLIEIFISLVLGGTLIIPSISLIKSTNYLFQYCFDNIQLNQILKKYNYKESQNESEINIKLTLMMTPSHLFSFKESRIKDILTGQTNIENVILGGEKFPSLNSLLNILYENKDYSFSKLGISLWNIYGVTENSVWATLYQVKSNDFNNCINNRNKIMKFQKLQKNEDTGEKDDEEESQKNIIVNNDFDLYSTDNVPLGTPLKNTIILLRYYNINGEEKFIEISENKLQYLDEIYFSEKKFNYNEFLMESKDWITGELWLGGGRQCWVDLDDDYRFREFIYTGDIVLFNKNNNNIYYYERSNQQIKLSGYRIHLEQCNFALEKIKNVKKCVSLLLNNSFKDELVGFLTYNEINYNEKDVINDIKKELKHLLPFYAIPTQLIILNEFPLNKNGKVDIKQLQNLYFSKIFEDYKKINLKNIIKQFDKSRALNMILKSINDLLKEIDSKFDNIVENSSNYFGNENKKMYFFEMGGNSLQAMTLAQRISKLIYNNEYNGNTDKEKRIVEDRVRELSLYIMNYPLYDIVYKVYDLLNENMHNINDNNHDESHKLEHTEGTGQNEINNNNLEKNIHNRKFLGFINKSQILMNYNNIRFDTFLNNNNNIKTDEDDNQTKIDFKKCIDASPTISITKIVINNYEKLEYTCFIGSHSSLFMSIDIIERKINWKVTLNDRIEGCACLSLCGKYVIVGCYDNYLYVLSIKNGDIVWRFKTRDIVKCTPVVDSQSGNIWFGSYDKILYEIDIYKKKLLGKFETKGPILGSPVIDIRKRIIYCCNLKGELFSININDNKIIESNKEIINYNYNWRFITKDNKPIFTTPKLSTNGLYLYFGCVDGYVYCIDTLKGELLWKYNTEGPIFSSPFLFNNDRNLVIGSHSNNIICLNLQDKESFKNNNNKILENCEWKIKTKSPVFASPFYLSFINNNNEMEHWIYAVDIDGNLFKIKLDIVLSDNECSTFQTEIKGNNKRIKLSSENELQETFNNYTNIISIYNKKLSGPIFSSPIVLNNQLLVIGSRDNNLYIIN